MRNASVVKWCVAAALVLVAPSACLAGTIRADSTYEAYAAAMAGINAIQADGALVGSFTASGNYLGDGWVLTAAHVANSPNGSGQFTFTINGASYTSSSVYINSGWTAGSLANDIALIKLSESNIAAQTVPLYAGTTAGLMGQVVYISGYGKTGTGLTGETGPDGVLHAGENLIEAHSSSILLFDFDDPTASSDGYAWSQDAALPYEYALAHGDSGGGDFVLVDGKYVLAGLNIGVSPVDKALIGKYGDIDGLTSVADYRDWIVEVTGHDFTVVPEPATLVLLALGSLVMARRRRAA